MKQTTLYSTIICDFLFILDKQSYELEEDSSELLEEESLSLPLSSSFCPTTVSLF